MRIALNNLEQLQTSFVQSIPSDLVFLSQEYLDRPYHLLRCVTIVHRSLLTVNSLAF